MPVDRAVGAVGGAEGVVDVDVAELRERGAEGLHRLGVGLHRAAVLLLDLALFLDVEAQVLEQHDLAGLQRRAGLSRPPGRRSRAGTCTGLPSSSASRFGDGLERVLRELLPVGPAEVAHQHEARALVEHVADRRQRRAQTLVVLDLAVLDRHVEVDAHQDAPAREGEVFDEELGHASLPTSRRPSSPCSAADPRSGSSSPTRCRTRTPA